jgi:hypothetical protein
MKILHSVFIIAVIFLFFFSCTTNKIKENVACLPGYVWINYVGESDHITRFTLIRTCEHDSSYLVSAQEDWNIWYKNKTFFDIYCNNYLIDTKQFFQLKEYIRANNPHKTKELVNVNNRNAVKIVCVDRCDSIKYIINAKDIDYFTNMIEFVKPDETLRDYFAYYQKIQERSLK